MVKARNGGESDEGVEKGLWCGCVTVIAVMVRECWWWTYGDIMMVGRRRMKKWWCSEMMMPRWWGDGEGGGENIIMQWEDSERDSEGHTIAKVMSLSSVIVKGQVERTRCWNGPGGATALSIQTPTTLFPPFQILLQLKLTSLDSFSFSLLMIHFFILSMQHNHFPLTSFYTLLYSHQPGL